MGDSVKEQAAVERRSLARSMGLISRFTLLSRFLALGRDQLFLALVGAGSGIHGDAFVTAFRIPNLLRDLFAEGALSAAFVPTYARTLKAEGRAEALRLASRVMTLLLAGLAALVALGILVAPTIVHWLAPGFDGVPGKTALTVSLTRIMLPFLPLVSLAAVAMGVLNAEERYGPPALAPAMFNVVALVIGGVLWALGWPPEVVVFGWALGTLLGGLAQLAVQLPEIHRLGWRPRLEWAPFDPRVREILALMAPATLGLAAVQINIFIGSNFASHEQGAVTWLQSAFRVLYLPIGLFGVAIGTLATTGSARRVAAGDLDGLRRSLRDSLRMLGFLTIPATIGLMVLARPIVRLLFERARYGPEDTHETAAALMIYAVGLVAYSSVKVLAPVFYGLGDARVPLLGSVAAVGSSVALMYAGHVALGYRVVALATSVGAFVNVGVLVAVFERRVGGLRGSGLLGAGLRMAAVSLVMGLSCWAAACGLEGWVGTRGLLAKVVTGLGPVLAGVVIYLGVAGWARIPEAEAVLGLLRRRVPGLRGAA